MIEQMPAINTAVLVVMSLIGYEVIRLITLRFFEKTVDAEYITASHCRDCKNEINRSSTATNMDLRESLRQLGQSIDMLRGIVLVLAVRAGVEEKTLQDLANRKGAA